MSIKITITGAEKLLEAGKRIRDAKDKINSEIQQVANLFGINAVSIIKEKYLSGPKPMKLGVGKTGQLRARTMFHVEQSGNKTMIRFGNPLVYARIHEKGGNTRPVVTRKMRAFAWRRFFETGDEMFKWLALTKKNRLNIKIPARPYLSPGVRDAFPKFQENIRALLKERAKEGFKGAN